MVEFFKSALLPLEQLNLVFRFRHVHTQAQMFSHGKSFYQEQYRFRNCMWGVRGEADTYKVGRRARSEQWKTRNGGRRIHADNFMIDSCPQAALYESAWTDAVRTYVSNGGSAATY
jgi:hypothetical protein